LPSAQRKRTKGASGCDLNCCFKGWRHPQPPAWSLLDASKYSFAAFASTFALPFTSGVCFHLYHNCSTDVVIVRKITRCPSVQERFEWQRKTTTCQVQASRRSYNELIQEPPPSLHCHTLPAYGHSCFATPLHFPSTRRPPFCVSAAMFMFRDLQPELLPLCLQAALVCLHRRSFISVCAALNNQLQCFTSTLYFPLSIQSQPCFCFAALK